MKLKDIKKNKVLKKPLRIDLSKKHGFKNDKKHIVVITKVSKRKNKRKARKGKVFGKISSQGCIKRKKKHFFTKNGFKFGTLSKKEF